MFRLGYIAQELRRRRGRALLTSLGLGLGIALVVAVTSLSTGLDRAQDKVFAPLAEVGRIDEGVLVLLAQRFLLVRRERREGREPAAAALAVPELDRP